MRKSLVLFGILDDSDVEWMLRAGIKSKVTAKSVLITEGEPLGSVYIVLSGQFGVTMAGSGKRIATLLPGEVVGEMSFVDSRPPSANVTADQDSWVLDIPRREIKERLAEEPAFGARFFRAVAVFLSSRLRTTDASLGYGSAVLQDHGTDDDGAEIPMDILDNINVAGIRFSVLQERTRSLAGSGAAPARI